MHPVPQPGAPGALPWPRWRTGPSSRCAASGSEKPWGLAPVSGTQSQQVNSCVLFPSQWERKSPACVPVLPGISRDWGLAPPPHPQQLSWGWRKLSGVLPGGEPQKGTRSTPLAIAARPGPPDLPLWSLAHASAAPHPPPPASPSPWPSAHRVSLSAGTRMPARPEAGRTTR